jgi:ArsR family transcriptional regulator, arsenate/arsenite/antimonite-responsive transcriptional repressor
MMYTPGMGKKNAAFSLDVLFRALADATRLRLLNLIADREICVCYFVEILKISQPKISRHLAYLRRAGIAAARRQGKWMHYRLTIPGDAVAAGILRETLRHLREKPEMKRDIARLSSACCAPQGYELLQHAPQPAALRSISQ